SSKDSRAARKRFEPDGSISKEFIDRSVELIRSGTGHNVNLSTASAAHFGRIASGLHLEFSHCVGGRAQIKSIERRIGVSGAIEQKIISVGPIAPDTDG